MAPKTLQRLIRRRGVAQALPGRPAPRISWWFVMSAIAVGLILGIGGLELFRMIVRPLALLVLAVSIAAALAPVVERLSHRVPYGVAVALVYIVLVLVVVTILGSTVPLVVTQVRGLLSHWRDFFNQLTMQLSLLGFDTSNLMGAIMTELGRVGEALFTLPVRLISTLFEMVVTLFLSLYWLILTPGTKRFFLSFFNETQKERASTIICQMGTAMGGYLRGSAINGLIIGVLEYIGLLIIGVPFALTLASLAGLLEFFPTIGPLLSGTLVVAVGLSVSPRTAVIVLIFAVVLQQLEGHILVPIIMRSQAEVSPLLSILAVLSGAAIGGLLGALIAIPLVSAISVLVRMVIAPAIRSANGVKES